MRYKITKKQLIFIVIVFLELVLLPWFPENFNTKSMAIISIIQVVFLCVAVLKLDKRNYYLCIFISLIWLFHCGQILKDAFDIEGIVWLDFSNYGNNNSFLVAFKYYYVSMLAIALGIFCRSLVREKISTIKTINWKLVAKLLIILGIIPRIYVDVNRFFYAVTVGYSKVNSLPIAAPIQAIAFFFDAGVLIELRRRIDEDLKSTVLFWGVFIYKALTMITGARQDAFCFLIIWIYVYYLIKRKSIKQLLKIIVLAYIGLVFIEIIGDIRGEGQLSWELLISGKNNAQIMFGNVLGEFGASFCTLVVAIQDIPQYLSFGFGRSYVAGVVSVIPGLLSKIQFLKESATFTTSLPSNITYAFGGSFIAESYYNFKWLGIVVSFVVGWCAAFCQINMINYNNKRNYGASIVALVLLLFIRGYFVDMTMKLAYLWLFIWAINYFFKRRKQKL